MADRYRDDQQTRRADPQWREDAARRQREAYGDRRADYGGHPHRMQEDMERYRDGAYGAREGDRTRRDAADRWGSQGDRDRAYREDQRSGESDDRARRGETPYAPDPRDSGLGRHEGQRDERRYQGGGYRDDAYTDQGYRPDESRGFLRRATDEMQSWFGDEEAERRRVRDAQRGDEGAQHHRGRGPRNYRRADTRIEEDINDRLTASPALDASDIVVTVSDGEVTLDGYVETRQDKRRAEDLADDVMGVRHVQNNLRLRERGYTAAAGQSGPAHSATGSTGRTPESGAGTGVTPDGTTSTRSTTRNTGGV